MRYAAYLSICVGLGLVGCTSDGTGALPIISNPQGFTLYSNYTDTSASIACVTPCTQYWIPAGSAVDPSQDPNFGTTTRADDGTVQVTYYGRPLYTFVQDTAPGQATGDDFSDQFGSASFYWVAARLGQDTSQTPPGGGGGGGYGGGGGGGLPPY